MIDIVRDTIVVMLFATLIPVVAVIWKMAFMELFGNDRARDLAESAMWEADRLRSQLWRARDRAWKLARERNHWRLDCLEQCKLLAMGADREEKLRADLFLAHKLAESAMWEADRLRAQLRKEQA